MSQIRKEDVRDMLAEAYARMEAAFGAAPTDSDHKWAERGLPEGRVEIVGTRKMRFYTSGGVFEVTVSKPRSLNQ